MVPPPKRVVTPWYVLACWPEGSGAPVTGAGAGVAEGLPGDGEEPEVVAVGPQRQLQHAVGPRPAHLAVGLGCGLEGVARGAARPHGELADSVGAVGPGVRRLGGEPLVDVDVTVEDHVGAVVVEGAPQRRHLHVVAMGAAGVEARVVPQRHGAAGGAGRQVGPEPLFLGAPGPAAADRGAVAVEDHDVPGTEVVAVPALPGLPGRRPEVPVVTGGPGGVVVVVAGHGAGPVLVATPGRGVAVLELAGRAVVVDVVAGGVHDGRRVTGNGVEELGGGLG